MYPPLTQSSYLCTHKHTNPLSLFFLFLRHFRVTPEQRNSHAVMGKLCCVWFLLSLNRVCAYSVCVYLLLGEKFAQQESFFLLFSPQPRRKKSICNVRSKCYGNSFYAIKNLLSLTVYQGVFFVLFTY